MRLGVKIGAKITIYLLGVVWLAITAVCYLYYAQVEQMLLAGTHDKLSLTASVKAAQLQQKYQGLEVCLARVETSTEVFWSLQRLHGHLQQPLSPELHARIFSRLDTFFMRERDSYKFSDMLLLSTAGTQLYGLQKPAPNLGEEAFVAQQALASQLMANGNLGGGVLKSAPFRIGDQLHIYIGRRLLKADRLQGFAIMRYSLTHNIGPALQSAISGEMELLLTRKTSEGGGFELLACEGPVKGPLLRIEAGRNYGKAIQYAAVGEASGFIADLHHQHQQKTLAYWRYLPEWDWGLVVQQPYRPMAQELKQLLYKLSGISLLVLLVSGGIAYLLLSILFLPLQRLKSSIQMLGKGILPGAIDTSSPDEVGDMARAVADLVGAFNKTARFAQEIGQGNYDANFSAMSPQDVLGNALLAMRQSIRMADENDRKRQWTVESIAEFGQLMRFRNNLAGLGNDTLPFLVQKVGAAQGAFYTTANQDEQTALVMQASYAYSKPRKLKAAFKMGEGLVGQCGLEQETLLYTEIPADYAHVSSGILGDRKPYSLLLVPLIDNHQTYGVLELASVWPFEPYQIKFIEEVSSIIARAIFNIKINEQTERMLLDSQRLGSELQAKQRALEEQTSAMAQAQSQLEEANEALQHKIAEVNQAQKRMALLLENASEVIAIYEGNGVLRYVSPSSERILGYLPEEIIGLAGTVYMPADYERPFLQFFEHLLEHPELSESIQYEYVKKNGERVWVEATGTNLMHDPAIQGVLLNITDITERRLAEKEQRMRNLMQALSENSPDMIVRINAKGMFYYTNPTISQLTGRKREYFMSRSIYDVKLPDEVLEVWQYLFKQVMRTKVAMGREMAFPAMDGLHDMQVSAIPEFGEAREVESVLLVSHDITDRKREAQALEMANRKMTESISYAHRIQSAILPQEGLLRKLFPESFMFYRPRDIVSGDFPWVVQKGDDIFVAAVDCTGHGVPGALISVIGYFLLQEAVAKEINSVGEVLDSLHEGVIKTLNQSEEDDGSPKDGMDIALCRINLKQGVLEYAGAHRTLYYMQKSGNLIQYRGDRFPIGGAGYRNRTAFTTHRVKFDEGDEAYIFSDGYTDQFGGIHNRKMGAQVLRAMIEDQSNEDMPMQEKGRALSKNFSDWMGNRKQTDDVLLIGIRLFSGD